MFNRFKALLVTICSILVFTATPTYAFQMSTSSENNTVFDFAKDKTIDDNYAVFGNTLNLKGTVVGDLVSFGNEISVDGTTNGNILGASNMFEINGKVDRDVFVAGNGITISKDAVINGDLFVAGNSIQIDGEVKGMVYSGSSNLVVNGKVGKGIKAGVSDFTLGPDSVVNGNIVYYSDKQANISSTSKHTGTIEFKQSSKEWSTPSMTKRVTDGFYSMLSILVVAILLILIMPRKMEMWTNHIKDSFWKSFGLGFVFLFILPILIFILLITMIGIPLSIILTGFYILAIYISKIIFANFLGNAIVKSNWNAIWKITLGIFVLSILNLIPIVGPIIGFIALTTGLGAISLGLIAKK